MTECSDCKDAAAMPWHAFTVGCKGCEARAVARGPHFYRVRKGGRLDSEYRRFIEKVGVTHDEVKAAAAVDKLGVG